MADFVFPQPEVGEFEAPNGLTYFHDGTKWVIKSIPAGDGDGVEYLPLTGGTQHKMKGDLYLGKHKICGVADPERSDDAATRRFVEEQINAGGLSHKEKMYLQGFLPYKVKSDTNMRPGYLVPKDRNYQYTLEPEKWKYVVYSVEDAYGNDTAGMFANHMHTEDVSSDYRAAQVWLARENGLKIGSYIGPINLYDRNFEDRSDMTIESECTFVTSKYYDLQSLRINADEIIWIKCSRWG